MQGTHTIVTAVQRWRTFNGKMVTPAEMDQQHLSNVYWFHLLFCNTLHKWAVDEIKKRFNGQIMDYRPHTEFVYELNMLQRRGMIMWLPEKTNDLVKYGAIVHNGSIIGEIQIPTHE